MPEIQAVFSTFSWYRIYHYQVLRETWRKPKKRKKKKTTHLCLSPTDLNTPWWAVQQSKLSQCRRVYLWNQSLLYTIKVKLLPFYIWVAFQVFSKGIHYSALLEIFFPWYYHFDILFWINFQDISISFLFLVCIFQARNYPFLLSGQSLNNANTNTSTNINNANFFPNLHN